jgi:hypothetical protein
MGLFPAVGWRMQCDVCGTYGPIESTMGAAQKRQRQHNKVKHGGASAATYFQVR